MKNSGKIYCKHRIIILNFLIMIQLQTSDNQMNHTKGMKRSKTTSNLQALEFEGDQRLVQSPEFQPDSSERGKNDNGNEDDEIFFF